MKIAKRSEKGESKNRPVATNFQFLKILAPFILWDSFLLGRACPKPCWNEYGKLELLIWNLVLKVLGIHYQWNAIASIKSSNVITKQLK